MVSYTYGDYVFRDGVLSLSYGYPSGDGSQMVWYKYQVTRTGNTLRLVALNGVDAPPSATLMRTPKTTQKKPRR